MILFSFKGWYNESILKVRQIDFIYRKEVFKMKTMIKTYPVISTIALICLLLGLLTSFYGDAMYDLLAFHSKPVYGWQYVSGTLMHGSKGAPIWFYGSICC